MFIENPFSTSPNAFAVLECFHIAGFALAIGMTALVDFRLLGFGAAEAISGADRDALSNGGLSAA